ncbi:MAG: hypothetical protein ACOZNI_21310 [Myxococcota bacterium]
MLLALACVPAPEPSPEPADTGEPPPVTLDGACPMASDLGGFTVEAADGYSLVDGTVLDGVVPVSVLAEVSAAGECRLLRRENPHCDPACDVDETCDLDGVCVPYPGSLDLGVVTVTGLAEAVAMEPVQPGNRYFDTRLPHPAFEPGATIVLRSEGGALDPLLLHGVGVDLLATATDTLVVAAGEDLAVAWDPPAGTDVAEVVLELSIDQHGASPLRLDCAFSDSGAGTVPGALVQALVDAGVTGFPSASLRRRTIDAAEVDGGCVDFEVRAGVALDLRVAGYTPCDDDGDCPTGTTCDEATEICE